jgi:hypothetical protein
MTMMTAQTERKSNQKIVKEAMVASCAAKIASSAANIRSRTRSWHHFAFARCLAHLAF